MKCINREEKIRKKFVLILVLSSFFIHENSGEVKQAGTVIKPFIIPLDGNWKFKQGDDHSFRSTEFDDSLWVELPLPSTNLMKYMKTKKGFIWLRKKITIPARPDNDLSFQAGEILNADEVYFNGGLIGKSGKFPPDFRTTWQEYRNYPIGRDAIKSGDNLIAIRVFCDAECWITGPLELVEAGQGIKRKILYDFFRKDMPACLCLLLVFISFFFLIYHFKKKDEKEYLYFSLFCFSISLSIIPQIIETHYSALPFSSNIILALTQTGVLNFAPFYLAFLFHYINGKMKFILKISILLPAMAASVIMIFSNDRSVIILVRNLGLYYLIAVIALVISMLIYGVLKNVKRSFILLISILPVLFLSIHDIAVFRFGLFNDRIAFYIYGLPVIVIIFTYYFILNHIKYIRENEKLKIESLKLMENFNKAVILTDRYGIIASGNERAGTLLKNSLIGQCNTALFPLFGNNREFINCFNESVSKKIKKDIMISRNEGKSVLFIQIEPVLLDNDVVEHLIIIVEEEDFFSTLKSSYELTAQELKIIFHVIDGRMNKEIASMLEIKIDTVKKHISSIYRKTGALNRMALANIINSRRKI